jgi:hypothetical protein
MEGLVWGALRVQPLSDRPDCLVLVLDWRDMVDVDAVLVAKSSISLESLCSRSVITSGSARTASRRASRSASK